MRDYHCQNHSENNQELRLSSNPENRETGLQAGHGLYNQREEESEPVEESEQEEEYQPEEESPSDSEDLSKSTLTKKVPKVGQYRLTC